MIVAKRNENLVETRKNRGLTQVQIAEKAQISERQYARIERETQDPHTSVSIRIADSLGVKKFEDFKKLFGAGTPNKSSTN